MNTNVKTKKPKSTAPAATPEPARAAEKPSGENAEKKVIFYYDKDNRQYWRESPQGEFVITNEMDLRRHLKMAGQSTEIIGANGLKSFEVELCIAQNEKAVDNVISLSGHKAGIFEGEDGRKILVPKKQRLIVPVQGSWKNFETFFVELLAAKQIPYAFGWIKVALEDLYTLNPSAWRHHQLLVLVGEPDCGKSFFQLLLTRIFGGRETDPYLWMVGKSDFNEDLAEAAHLRMEDKEAFRDIKSRSAFGSKIKQLTVGSDTPVHGKKKKQFLAPCFRRLSLSTNHDANYITVLPPLDDSIKDKMMLFKCSKAKMLPNFSENMARFSREIPAFIHYLLNEFKAPENLESQRFGITSYLNPEVVELLQDFEPHMRFKEIVDGTFFSDGQREPVRENASEISTRLTGGKYSDTARKLLQGASACGQLLGRLEKEYPSRFSRGKNSAGRYWIILPPETSS